MSLSYGRLTVQSTDRHPLQTITVAQEPRLLVTLMWGDARDLKLLTELGSLGNDSRSLQGEAATVEAGVVRKGVHLTDKSREPVSSDPLRTWHHIPATHLRGALPIISSDMMTPWPADKLQVVGLNDDLWRIFEGPRILFSGWVF